MRESFHDSRVIVIKIGSNLLTCEDGSLDTQRIDAFAHDVDALIKEGRKPVIISSGAVAAGIGKIGLSGRPVTVPDFQASAAVGQIALMEVYCNAFRTRDTEVAQILLTRDDFNDRSRYLNIRNCLTRLMDADIVPIINENDSVAVDELKFGDNDMLAGYVTMSLPADLLIILSSIEGLRTSADDNASVISVVEEITPEIEELVYSEQTTMGTGGMQTKIASARMVTAAGEPVVLADGRLKNVLAAVCRGEEIGTLFKAAARKVSGKKRWMAFSAQTAGSLTVDDGAAAAVCERGTSLLAAGVTGVEGTFEAGELIAVLSSDGAIIARGLTNYSSEDIARIKGVQSAEIESILGHCAYHEILHRDNLVLELIV